MSIEIYRKNKDKNVYFRWSNEQTKSNNIVLDWNNSASNVEWWARPELNRRQ